MRDLFVTLIIIYGVLYSIKRPHIGILLWSWLGYMNPHRLCYGFAYSQPFSQIVAIVTTLSIIFTKENKSLPKDKLVYLILFFIFWMGLTTMFAFNSDAAVAQYTKILKIHFSIFLTLMLFKSRERINQLLWVIVISIGFFGVKGGLFTIAKGGSYHVFGPPESVIEDNNTLAVALLMIMPIMVYLKSTLTSKWQQQLMLFSLISIGFSVLGSQSRGAFLAISAVGYYFWMHSNSKIKSALIIMVFVGIAYAILPDTWYQRMNTINTYQQDESANGRLSAWEMAFNVANRNLLGGGLDLWSPSTYLKYLPGYDPITMPSFVAHSIYFSVLGEHGWFGLLLFLTILLTAWLYTGKLYKEYNGKEGLQWIADLAKMIKISLLAYCTGGAFLSLSYLDLAWHLISITILLKVIASQSNNAIPDTGPIIKPTEHRIKIDSQGYIR